MGRRRCALLEAVFRERVEALCALARDLTSRADTRAALLEWLSAVTASARWSRHCPGNGTPPGPAAEAARLLGLTVAGISPRQD
ncbi:hypothetical protein [Micromonospora sp. NPDC005173]|uniref:hypothetical protein n=1 Tax=Micromonospora sp. NPDC005173 TaxID=3157165 RepID=UPI0033B6AA58